jgi:hypothetical protein
VTAPTWLRRHLVAAALRAPFFNLELHGIDLADASAGRDLARPHRAPARSAAVARPTSAPPGRDAGRRPRRRLSLRDAGGRRWSERLGAARDRARRQLVAALVLGDAGVAGDLDELDGGHRRQALPQRAISSWFAFAFQPFDSTPIE